MEYTIIINKKQIANLLRRIRSLDRKKENTFILSLTEDTEQKGNKKLLKPSKRTIEDSIEKLNKPV